jgi:hypothetical protein
MEFATPDFSDGMRPTVNNVGISLPAVHSCDHLKENKNEEH